MGKHNIVWGRLRHDTRKKVSSGVATWSEVCLAITTLMLLCSMGFRQRLLIFLWTFKRVMPQNLPQQILQQIVSLSADDNSQREVARMLGVSQGCISKILWCKRETGWPHQRKRGGFDEHLHATGRLSTAPNGQNAPLHLGSSSANAEDPPVWEADVSSNHSEMVSGHRILISASSQMF